MARLVGFLAVLAGVSNVAPGKRMTLFMLAVLSFVVAMM